MLDIYCFYHRRNREFNFPTLILIFVIFLHITCVYSLILLRMKICPGFTSKSWLIHKVGFLEKQDKEMKDNGIGTIEVSMRLLFHCRTLYHGGSQVLLVGGEWAIECSMITSMNPRIPESSFLNP